MKVREGTLKDLEQLTNLRSEFALFEQEYLPGSEVKSNDSLKKETKELLGKNDTTFLVVEEKDKILGYLNFFIYPEFKDKIFVGELFIETAARRKGTASLLFERLLEWAKINNRKIIRLNVAKLNKKAIKFFNKIGFKIFKSDYINLEKKSKGLAMS